MAKQLPQVWAVCQPKKDVLDESFLVSELALDLYAVARGKASPPYDTAVSFLEATEITSAIGSILRDVLGRLAGSKKAVNPVIVFDVGFGGGKTHAMAILYYAARDGKKAELKKLLGDISITLHTDRVSFQS
jgi:predicted AAA+ superfamily ATPase